MERRDTPLGDAAVAAAVAAAAPKREPDRMAQLGLPPQGHDAPALPPLAPLPPGRSGPTVAAAPAAADVRELMACARHGRYKEAKALLKSEGLAAADGTYGIDTRDEYGNTALMVACQVRSMHGAWRDRPAADAWHAHRTGKTRLPRCACATAPMSTPKTCVSIRSLACFTTASRADFRRRRCSRRAAATRRSTSLSRTASRRWRTGCAARARSRRCATWPAAPPSKASGQRVRVPYSLSRPDCAC